MKASARKKNVPLNNYVSLFQSGMAMPISSPEDEVIRSEDRREFLQKMSKELSDFEFRVTVMYMDGLSCAEICEATGKDGKSVDNAIQRAKKNCKTSSNAVEEGILSEKNGNDTEKSGEKDRRGRTPPQIAAKRRKFASLVLFGRLRIGASDLSP